MESVAFIQWCLDHLNYWTITLLMAIESSFIPFPSEVVVPRAAYKAAGGNSDLNVFLVVIFATIGANIGAIINYYIAYFVGRPLVYKFANSRFGHMCLIDEAKVQNAEHYFDKHGALSTFIGRLIPAVRQLISIPAGLAKMKLSTFLLYTTLGAGIWNAILAAIGYYLQSVVPEEQLLSTVTEYSHELGYCFIAIGVLIVGFLIYKTAFKGTPVTLAGEFVKAGTSAPEFTLVKGDLSNYTLKDGKGKYLILNIFPSMDTGVCATSVRKFNQLAANQPNTVVLAISKDLPFAQGRFCTTEGITNVIPLSDYRYTSDFAEKYGVLMTDGPLAGLLARSVVVIDPEGKVVYTELVPEITQEPNYEAALKAVK